MNRLIPVVFLAALILLFSAMSPRFATAQNLINILVQSSSIAVVEIGMTYVLLTAGIDLVVVSVIFLSA